MAKITAAEREEARTYLRKLLPVGSTVYGSVVHVARSGPTRCTVATARPTLRSSRRATGGSPVAWIARNDRAAREHLLAWGLA